MVLALVVLASCANSAPPPGATGSLNGNYGGFGTVSVTSGPGGPTGPKDLAVDLTLTEAGGLVAGTGVGRLAGTLSSVTLSIYGNHAGTP